MAPDRRPQGVVRVDSRGFCLHGAAGRREEEGPAGRVGSAFESQEWVFDVMGPASELEGLCVGFGVRGFSCPGPFLGGFTGIAGWEKGKSLFTRRVRAC